MAERILPGGCFGSLPDESYGNGTTFEIDKEPCSWIETEDVPSYHAWPTLTNMGNDHLAAVCSGGRESHVDPFGRVRIYESSDCGRTWSKPRILTNGPLDDRDAGIIVTPAGTWLVNYFTSLAFADYGDRDGGQAHWKKMEDNISISMLRREHGFFMLRSSDRGKTWSEKYEIPVHNVHGPIVLQDCSLFYCGRAVDPGKYICTSRHAEDIVCLRSEDDGLTWQEISRFKTGDFGEHQLCSWHELHSVQAATGEIITHIRLGHNSTLQIISKDGGKSWDEPRAVASGYPSHLLRLRDGRLLMSYGYRQKPYGNRARISSDNGKSWSAPIILSDDGVSADLGYTSSAELSDGTFVSLWYEFRPSKENPEWRPALDEPSQASLRVLRWSLC